MSYRDLVVKHAGEVSKRMSQNGYNSVFEKIDESSHRGPKITTLWINLAAGDSKMTVTEGWQTDMFDVKALTAIEHNIIGETDYSRLQKLLHRIASDKARDGHKI